MIEETFANRFAEEWVNSWNAHSLDAIMEHYADDISFQSPVIVQVNNDPSGTINSKAALKEYFERALQLYPDLHFDLYKVLISINSVVLYYKTINDMVTAEYMELNEAGKVIRVRAHYSK